MGGKTGTVQPFEKPPTQFVTALPGTSRSQVGKKKASDDRNPKNPKGLEDDALWEAGKRAAYIGGMPIEHIHVRMYGKRGWSICGSRPDSCVVYRYVWVPKGQDPKAIFRKFIVELAKMKNLELEGIVVGGQTVKKIEKPGE